MKSRPRSSKSASIPYGAKSGPAANSTVNPSATEIAFNPRTTAPSATIPQAVKMMQPMTFMKSRYYDLSSVSGKHR